MYVYIASSWRNEHQPFIVSTVHSAGCEVYDFRNPTKGNTGFAWSAIDPNWKDWTDEEYEEALKHPLAIEGFGLDFKAMQRADVFIGVNPCGRSAHLELGWAVGQGKPTAMCMFDDNEPDLMYKMFECRLYNDNELRKFLTACKMSKRTK